MINIPEEVKVLFRKDSVKKNIRIHFPNGERADIVNSNIVEESFSFTESICSQEKLKFGLCEASVVQFECVGIENIKGYEIEAYCEIDISSLSDDFTAEYGMRSSDVAFPYYRIPYGVFVIDSCQRQADMRKRKVIAYSRIIENNEFSVFEKEKHVYARNRAYSNGAYLCDFDVFKFIASNRKLKQVSYTMSELERNLQSFGAYRDVDQYRISLTIYNNEHRMDSLEETDKLLYFKNDYAQRGVFEQFTNAFYGFVDACIQEGYSINKEVFLEWFDKYYADYSLPFILYSGGYVWLEDGCEIIYPYISTNDFSWSTEIKLPYSTFFTLQKKEDDGSFTTLKTEIFDINEEIPKFFEIDTSNWLSITYFASAYSLDSLDVQQIMEGYFELSGYIRRNNRVGELEFVNISNNFSLYPSETLYPSEEFSPKGSNAGIWTRSCYRSAWYDDELTKPYDRVSVTYRNENGTEVYAYHAIVDEETEEYDEKDYQTYSLSDNYLIRNGTFTSDQINEILVSVAENIKNIRYIPADIELIGLPWVEAGDAITVITEDGAIETLILRRSLTGIQTLADNFESKG